MAYSIIVVGTNPLAQGEYREVPPRSELVYRIFTTAKRILDHDIVCFMNIGHGRDLIRISVRQMSTDLKQIVHDALIQEIPFARVEIFDQEERQVYEDETRRAE